MFGNTQTSAVRIIIHAGKVTTDASIVPATAVVAIYIRTSVLHDWKGEAGYTYSFEGHSRSLSEDLGGTWYEYGLGANFNATKNLHLYADIEAADGGEVDTDYRVNLGARWSF